MKIILSTVTFLLLGFVAMGQYTLSGIVKDSESGKPLEGAHIYVKGTDQGTFTANDGSFNFTVSDPDARIQVSFVGYRAKSILLNEFDSQGMELLLVSHNTLEEVVVKAVRASNDIPVTQKTLYRNVLESEINGQDPVFALEKLTPSVLAHSESGTNFVNYAQMRLRGIDQTRLNITLNGVPLNDMIDQGVFFSNFTDFGNSIESIQVQRGVGTSTYGTASYAGSINFESVKLWQAEPSTEIHLLGGSFDTYRISGEVFTGSFGNNFAFYSRFSKTLSDGYKNHSGTNSNSFYFSGGYFGDRDHVKLTAFLGRTQNELAYLPVLIDSINLDPKSNYLDPNDEDDFGQHLIQIQHTRWFHDNLSVTSSIYYGGAGGDFPFGFPDANGNLTQINFPLYNDHVGIQSALDLKKDNGLELTAGLHLYSFYRKNEEAILPDKENPYYSDKSQKDEISFFTKASYRTGKLIFFGDLQFRSVSLEFTPDLSFLQLTSVNIPERNWNFFNPKVGITFIMNENLNLYASFGRSSREPTRADILGSTTINSFNLNSVQDKNSVKEETVNDFELGARLNAKFINANLNFFHMNFENEIAPIGAFIPQGFVQLRKNISKSYRMGVELDWNWKPIQNFSFNGTFTYQKSQIDSFSPDGSGLTFEKVDPILSPNVIFNGGFHYSPYPWIEASLTGRYVSESFLELTNQPGLEIPSYFIGDLSFTLMPLEGYSLTIMFNNLTDKRYYTNGSSVDVDFDGIIDGPGYLVQPPSHFYVVFKIKF